MTSNNKPTIVQAVRLALSPARMATFEAITGIQGDSDMSALALYTWNAELSGRLLHVLHICEVVIRNATANVLELLYGERWPWSETFERSLPNPATGYKPRLDLQQARSRAHTAGKVIPELKFIFWQKMFTSRFDDRLWTPHLHRILPNMDNSKPVAARRKLVYSQLEQLRQLRNRIAHHEPIFTRDLMDDYRVALELIRSRCGVTALWLEKHESATELIAAKPKHQSSIQHSKATI